MAEPVRRSHQKKERPMVGVREFRETFPNITEPVTVMRSRRPTIEILGTWTPAPGRAKTIKSAGAGE